MAEGAVAYVITKSDGTKVAFAGSGDAFSSYVETKDLFHDSMDQLKVVQRIRILATEIDGTALSVQLKSRNDLSESFTSSEYYSIADGNIVNTRVESSKLVRLRFQDTTVNRTRRWGIASFTLLGQTSGTREI